MLLNDVYYAAEIEEVRCVYSFCSVLLEFKYIIKADTTSICFVLTGKVNVDLYSASS